MKWTLQIEVESFVFPFHDFIKTAVPCRTHIYKIILNNKITNNNISATPSNHGSQPVTGHKLAFNSCDKKFFTICVKNISTVNLKLMQKFLICFHMPLENFLFRFKKIISLNLAFLILVWKNLNSILLLSMLKFLVQKFNLFPLSFPY